MSFAAIGDLLKARIGKGHFSEKVTAALVCEEFDKIMLEVFGEIIQTNAKTMYLKDKVLTVACLSPVVAQEIRIKENQLLEKINSRFSPGDKIVGRVRILI
ncbi:MAG TPA: DciA family protein [Patescibacteria group bacterium]|nr:DciA family protein [Patescibacteria group bacterium]